MVRGCEAKSVLVIADGAAFGPEMELVTSLRRFKDVRLFLPESFEWLVLGSGLFDDRQTRETYLAYSKSRLNPIYLQEKQLKAIASTLPALGLDEPSAV